MHYFIVTDEQTDKLNLGVEYTITFDHVVLQGLSILFVVFRDISIEPCARIQTAFSLQQLVPHTNLLVRRTVTMFLDTEKLIKRLPFKHSWNFLGVHLTFRPFLCYGIKRRQPMGYNCICSEHSPGTSESGTALCCEHCSFSGCQEVVWSYLLLSFFWGCSVYNLLLHIQSIVQGCGCRSWNCLDHWIVFQSCCPLDSVGEGLGPAWGTVVNCPTRWSLLFIFGFLWWSSSWWWRPHIGGGKKFRHPNIRERHGTAMYYIWTIKE